MSDYCCRHGYLEGSYCPDCRSIVRKPEEPMTLRDQFAMAALTGLIGAYTYPEEMSKKLARSAYVIAEAMMSARGERR
jgi:hypothetical protein